MDDQPTVERLTRLIVFLAESLIETNAELIALRNMEKATLGCVADVAPTEFDRQMEERMVPARVIAADRLLNQLKADQQLAWLAVQVRSGTVH